MQTNSVQNELDPIGASKEQRSKLTKVLLRSFGLLSTYGGWLTAVTLVLNVGLGLIPPVIGLTAKALIDGLTVSKPDEAGLLFLLGLQAFLFMFNGVLTQFSLHAYTILGERVQMGLRFLVLEHASRLDLSFFELPENQDLLGKAQRELGFRPVLIVQFMLSGLQALITVLGFFGVVATIQPWLTLLLFVGLLPAILASKHAAQLTMDLYSWQTPSNRIANYLESILSDGFYAKEVRLNGLTSWLLPKIRQLQQRNSDERVVNGRRKAIASSLGDAFSTVLHYVSVGFIVVQTARGTLTIGEFTLLLTALSSVRTNMLQVVNQGGNLIESALLFSDLDTFLSVPTRSRSTGNGTALTEASEVRFEEVSFRYPGASELSLTNFSSVFKRNETVALVGSNGAGKTTLVKLLTRLYEPSYGTITINGRNAQEIELDVYRSSFAVILQDFTQYQFSIEENVVLAQPRDNDRLEHAARLAGLENTINWLPHGWHTPLGRSFDARGQDLSGGQWQRVALARALYRDAPILVLDEPTSSLDPESEAELFNSYKELSRDRICILITHRLANVRIADRIIVMDRGQITEEGTHDSLMELRGRYHTMFTAQASAYDSMGSKASNAS